MWTKKMAFNILKAVKRNLTFEEFNKLVNSDVVDFKMFSSACNSLRRRAESQKETYLIKDLIKKKKKENGDSDDDEAEGSNSKMPRVENGRVDLEELIEYLRHIATFSKRSFNEARIKQVLASNNWRALRLSDTKFNPMILERAIELLMAQ